MSAFSNTHLKTLISQAKELQKLDKEADKLRFYHSNMTKCFRKTIEYTIGDQKKELTSLLLTDSEEGKLIKKYFPLQMLEILTDPSQLTFDLGGS